MRFFAVVASEKSMSPTLCSAALIRLLIMMTICAGCKDVRAAERTITNPVASDGHDPWVIKHGEVYYYCYSHRDAVWVNSAKRIEEAVQFAGKEVWRPEPGKVWSKELWAPELHFFDGRWYIYVAADDGDNKRHRMYVLASETGDPLGKYAFRGKLADSTDKWAIDGTVLEYENKRYFIWSGWEGDVNVCQNLYIAPMSDPATISGERVLISTPEYDWEKIGEPLINEGPEVLKHGGEVFVIYSASGSWTDDYCLGQLKLTGNDPLNPSSWTKKNTPVFSGTGAVFSPGHASFTVSPDGREDWIVYHTAKKKGAGWNRNTRMQRFTWTIDGEPCFGYPVSAGIAIPAPGE